MNKLVQKYYAENSATYDTSRFDTLYGKVVHRSEISIVASFLRKWKALRSDSINRPFGLDLATGTGRFLPFFDFGVDMSFEMLSLYREGNRWSHNQQAKELASVKIDTGKPLIQADLEELPFSVNSIDYCICMHTFMHLPVKSMERILDEVHRICRPGSLFIVDVPNGLRRKLLGQKQKSWRSQTSFDKKEFHKLVTSKFKIISRQGLLFLPLHRFPTFLRKLDFVVYLADKILARWIFPKFASYHIYVLAVKE